MKYLQYAFLPVTLPLVVTLAILGLCGWRWAESIFTEEAT